MYSMMRPAAFQDIGVELYFRERFLGKTRFTGPGTWNTRD
jgi:hypothetical protein